ncbi:MAG: imidazole glycerol phosphate synthase subunit HisH [Armatimonadetes bacterium]|nr:imidazole glycerol phosphate synthase subunit HisH [Armatimonadota bacterium]
MTIGVVDYGIGNLLSVCRAVAVCGGNVKVLSTPAEVPAVDRLVVPGVGAFGDCAAALRDQGFWEPVVAFAASERPFLGICVGMQMLFDVGLEFGQHQGLGILPGQVVEIDRLRPDGTVRKRPHIGWVGLQRPEGRTWEGTILEGTDEGTKFYFVHTFSAVPEVTSDRLADVDYDGFRVSAAVNRGNVTGTQFHPEKSGPAGLAVVSRFLKQ